MTKDILTQWRDIPETDGIYQASDHGEIRSIDRKYKKRNRWGFIVDVFKKAEF